MDIKTRLTRRPVTTALWVILVTAMALFLSVGAALMYSSGSLADILDDYHTSIAVRTDRGVTRTPIENGVRDQYENKTLSQEQMDYLNSLDSVEGIYFHTLTGAYCPELTPRISNGGYMLDESYDGCVVIGTISRMTEPEYYGDFEDWSRIGGDKEAQATSFAIEIQVEEFVCGNDEYTRWGTAFSDGYLNMYVDVRSAAAMDFFQVGERYIFYGEYDRQGFLLDVNLENSGHPWLRNRGTYILENDAIYELNSFHYQTDENGNTYLYDALKSGPYVSRISGSLDDFLARPENEAWKTLVENQDIAQHSLPVMGTEGLETMYMFVNNDAGVVEGRYFTQEEYDTGAKVCILNETQAQAAGIGVGDTVTLSQYWCHNFRVDDTNFSTDLYYPDGMLNNPTVGEYQPDTEFLTEDEVFTVVGLYRIRNEWSDTSYSLTPNTIFIPQKAQPEGGFGGMPYERVINRENLDGTTETYSATEENATYGVYFSMKLNNGKVSAFKEAMEASEEFAGQFLTIDQGFGKIQESLNSISATALKLLALIGGGWALLLVLYVLLYQGGQRNNLGIMRSLGASPRTVRSYLFGSGMTVAAVGVVMGAVVTGAVMNVVQNKLFETTFGTAISEYSNAVLSQDSINQMVTGSQLPIWAILAIAAGQLLVFAAVLWLQADSLSKKPPRTLLGK